MAKKEDFTQRPPVIRSDEGVFVFHPDLDGCAAQGETIEEAISNLDSMREAWLSVRLADGLPIEEPVNEDECNGRISLRMSSHLHADLLKISRRQRVSLNQLLNNIVSEYVGGNRLLQQVLEAVREIKPSITVTSAALPPHRLLSPTAASTAPRASRGGRGR